MHRRHNSAGSACLLLLLAFGCQDSCAGTKHEQEADILQAWRQKRAGQTQTAAAAAAGRREDWGEGGAQERLAAIAEEDQRLDAPSANGMKYCSEGHCPDEIQKQDFCSVEIQSPMDVYYEFEQLKSLLATVSCSFGDLMGAIAHVSVNGKELGAAVPVQKGEIFLDDFASYLPDGKIGMIGYSNITVTVCGDMGGVDLPGAVKRESGECDEETHVLLGRGVATFQAGYSELGLDFEAMQRVAWLLEREEEGHQGGFFLEIGAFHGWKLSNSLQLEIAGWHGLCAEPFPHTKSFEWRAAQAFAGKHRLIQAAVLGEERDVRYLATFGREHRLSGGVVDFLVANGWSTVTQAMALNSATPGEIYELRSRTAAAILADNVQNEPCTIHFLSVDTEGSEADILASFPFSRYTVCSATVEHNGVDWKKALVRNVMAAQGLRLNNPRTGRDDFFENPACMPPNIPPPPCRLTYQDE